MTVERWERIKEIFDSTLERVDDERSSYIEKACEGDPDLLAEVERLLAEYKSADGFLEHPATWFSEECLSPGDIVSDRYRIISLLGRGGMGEVYSAHDQLIDETVALKTLRSDLVYNDDALRRFQTEIQLSRKVTHTNVCRVFDVGVHRFSNAGVPIHFFTMELIAGETLAECIRRQGPFSADQAFPLIKQMAAGLSAAHEAGVIHRDFKSANVILAGDRAVITDFGLARVGFGVSSNTASTTGHLAGTVPYMSPEQFSGEKVTCASDVYSFGVVLFEMASGRLPFADLPLIQAGIQRVSGNPVSIRSLVPDIDSRWAAVIERCLEREPSRRFTRAVEVEPILGAAPARASGIRKLLPNLARRFHYAVAFALFAIILVALFPIVSRFYQRDLQEGAKVLVTPMMNASGDTRFDGLTTAFRASVGQSPRFQLWDDGRLRGVLNSMRRDSQLSLNPEDWREVAFREGVSLLLFSTLSKVGTSYALAIHAEQIAAASTTPLHSWDRTFTASGPNGLFDSVRDATAWIRTETGETEIELSANNRLPQDITTASWEALKLFEQAQQLSNSGDDSNAIPLLRSTVDLDPEFALALMRLGDILVAQRKSEEGYRFWDRAIREGRKQRLSDRERLVLESRYALELGDYTTAESFLRQWSARFPNDPSASRLLASCLLNLGRYPDALSIARQHRERFGASLFTSSRIIIALGLSRKLDEIPAELELLKPLKVPEWELRFRGILSAVKEDYGDAQARFEELAALASGQDASRATSILAALAAERGDLTQAAKLLEQGLLQDKQAGENGLAAHKASALAFIESIRGNAIRSQAWANESVALEVSPQVVQQAVSVLARTGFIKDAERVAARMPVARGMRHESLSLRTRGELLAAKGKYSEALALLEEAAKKESSTRPKEYLARVLDLAGQHERARWIYTEIVNTPWLVWGSPESEWPGIRFLAKRNLQSEKGD